LDHVPVQAQNRFRFCAFLFHNQTRVFAGGWGSAGVGQAINHFTLLRMKFLNWLPPVALGLLAGAPLQAEEDVLVGRNAAGK